MNKAMFTQGPWQFTPAGPADSEGYGICSLWGEPGSAEQTANAHLIAAAPEMYEMLRRFLPHVTYDENGEEIFHGGDFEWNEDDDPMIDELKALLAKARGEV